MEDFSTLVGGIAGDGINEAGLTVARIMNQLGYRIYMYYDYPSLIRGGHNFSLVRAARSKIGCHHEKIDALIALNQETVERHIDRLKEGSFLIYDEDKVKLDAAGASSTSNASDIAGPSGANSSSGAALYKSCGIPVTRILKEEGAPMIMKNSCILGGFCRAMGIEWPILEEILKKHIPKKVEQNIKVARRGYDQASELSRIARLDQEPEPIVEGNMAIGMGLVRAGLGAYMAYPMTPSSSILDFMARSAAEDFGIKVVHPENEIAVMLMAQGFAYAGVRAAVGTSGGGFCLMTEGLSLAGMAEIPVAIVMAQRTGPSTGLPTYTAQGDLHFVISAGQGEFPRFVVAPGDSEEAYYWSRVALNMAWKYQIPSFILSDKMVSESRYSLNLDQAGGEEPATPRQWNGSGRYHRYGPGESGVSPLAYPPLKGEVIKSNSYVHEDSGITTEDPDITVLMNNKRILKGESLAKDLQGYETVKVFGDKESKSCILCWGSNKWVCKETAENLGLRMVQVLVLWPFPDKRLKEALRGTERIMAVECNSTGQLARMCACYGIGVDEMILKYDGRPFSLDELDLELKRRLA